MKASIKTAVVLAGALLVAGCETRPTNPDAYFGPGIASGGDLASDMPVKAHGRTPRHATTPATTRKTITAASTSSVEMGGQKTKHKAVVHHATVPKSRTTVAAASDGDSHCLPTNVGGHTVGMMKTPAGYVVCKM